MFVPEMSQEEEVQSSPCCSSTAGPWPGSRWIFGAKTTSRNRWNDQLFPYLGADSITVESQA
jgi:hypothetical protein